MQPNATLSELRNALDSRTLFQRRHYAFIAGVISGANSSPNFIGSPNWRNKTARRFADTFEATDPKFNRTKFLIACGLEPAL